MLNKKIGLIALLASFAAGDIMAGDFSGLNSYNVGDVLVCFRNGGNDMVVDVGQISTLTNGVSPNQRISINEYTGTQLAQVGANGVSWSAFTWLSDNTLFVTRPRTSAYLNTQTVPWPDQSSDVQAGTAGLMGKIPPGAYDSYYKGIYAPYSSAGAVIEEDDSDGNSDYPDGISYGDAVTGSYKSDFDGNFSGNPENTTPHNFSSSGTVVRSDFYQMTPTGGYGLGKWLGYFEFASNGTMTYVAYPSAVPVITSISRSGNTTTITYTTGIYGTYTLRGISSLTSGTPQASWPAVVTLVSGDTATHTYMDTDSSSTKFYTITAQ